MEGFTFYQEEGRPFQGRKLEKMRSFLEQQGLDLDEKVQYSVILDTGEGKIAACGSRQGNVLKCIAVDPQFQGEGLMVKLMNRIMKKKEAAPAPAPAPSREEQLLAEIRDLLREHKERESAK